MITMDQQQVEVINFITHLPPDVNPYLAAANMLEVMTHSPPSPPWARRLRIAILVLVEIMFFQSIYLLYQRFRMNKSPRVKCNDLGLLIVNISITSGIAYFLYSILTIYVFSVRIAADLGRTPSESTMLLIFGLKFFTVILGAWAFFWVCACQCAKIFWNSNLASHFNRDVLRNLIKWGVSIVFLCAAFGPLFPIAWKYTEASKALHEIESIADDVASILRSKAKNYDPQNFSRIGLLVLLSPANKLNPLQERLEITLRQAQNLYFADLCLLSLVYLPLLIISLRSLYKQSLSQVKIDAAITSDGLSKESPISTNIRRQRQRLVYHACCVYFATSIHLPMVLCQILFSGSPGFIKTVTWQEITFQGMSVPLAIVGNIILAILNLHAYIVFRGNNRPQMRNGTPSRADLRGQHLFQKLNHFGFGFVMTRSATGYDVTSEPGDLGTCENDHSSKEQEPRNSIKSKGFIEPNFGIKITQSAVSMIA